MNFEKNIGAIEKKIFYVFRDKSLLRQAFTRSSYCNEHRGTKGESPESNEVLEFLGDSILSSAIITLLMRAHTERYTYGIKTKLTEGDFSNIKSKLSDKKNLSSAMKELGLQKYLLLGEGDARLGIENEPSVMEDLFESIIGAIYLDSDADISRLLTPISKMLDISRYLGKAEAPIQSHKNALQEWCADKNHRREAPIYKTVSESGPDHKKQFERACTIGGKIYGVGIGKNQKIADALAAEAALKALTREFEMSKEKREDPVLVMQRLREIAKENKKLSPEFRDLGENPEKESEFSVECRFMGLSAVGHGLGKKEARERAAENMLKLLVKKAENEKTAKAQNKKAKIKKHTPTLENADKSKQNFTKAFSASSEQNAKKPTRVPTKRKKSPLK